MYHIWQTKLWTFIHARSKNYERKSIEDERNFFDNHKNIKIQGNFIKKYETNY